MKLNQWIVLLAQATACISVNASNVDPVELAEMKKIAFEEGAVRVAIVASKSALPPTTANDYPVLSRDLKTRTDSIKAELGAYMYRGGSWSSPTGQFGLTLKAEGLAILERSPNVISFRRDTSEKTRSTAHDLDGSLSALKKIIKQNGSAAAEVVLNSATVQYQILPDATTKIIPSKELDEESERLISQIKAAGLESSRFVDSISKSPSNPALVLAEIDLPTLITLQSHPAVRSLRPLGYKDPRVATWSSWALEDAEREGTVEVTIMIRGGLFYTTKIRWNSPAGRNQAKANHQALTEVLANAGIKAQPEQSARDTIGSAHVRLTPAQYKRLKGNDDPRILEVAANRLGGVKGLSGSVPLVNAPTAWSSGFTGTNQAIVVIDEGIRKSHEMFSMNGATKIIGEDCYGTRTISGWRSVCPNPNDNWDSPVGTPNSGEPNPNIANCLNVDFSQCDHGTYMASIAAGIASPNVLGGALQGVAPGAQLYSMNVFSYNMTSTPKQSGFHMSDLDFALERVVYLSGAANADPDSPAQMVVNMSIRSLPTYGSDCDAAAGAVWLQNWIDYLYSAGVPVVSITGNYGILNGISHPACSENVIKVAGVPIDGVGLTRASYSNLAAPSNFTKPIFFAPGGEKPEFGGPLVGAGRATATATFSGWGTSQAGAHVSGLAALFKSRYPVAGVDAFIDWVNDYASVPMSVSIPAGTFQYRRIAYSTGGP